MLSATEENYLKALIKISEKNSVDGKVGTNELALDLGVKPATVNDMLKRLKDKKLIDYEKYGKIKITKSGKKSGIEIIRRHRLWETFLFDKLKFTWDEIHEIAELLEHVNNPKLIERLDEFLNYPQFDPHGDVIPNSKGEIKIHFKKTLLSAKVGKALKMVAMKENSDVLLKHLFELGLGINKSLKVVKIQPFDLSMNILVEKKTITISNKLAENIFVVCNDCKVIGECNKKLCDLE
jgi:DtxR family Mn-dependent transcriptional regulator